MPAIHWDDSYLIGIDQFDRDHKHLVNLLNQTYDGFTESNHRQNIESVLDELIEYASEHFRLEEHWMAEVKYPRLAHHQKEHQLFATRILEIQSDFEKGNINLSSLDLFTFLRSWLTDHILKTDADYAAYIRARKKDG